MKIQNTLKIFAMSIAILLSISIHAMMTQDQQNLIRAVQDEDISTVKALLEKKVDPNFFQNNSWPSSTDTPLLAATHNGYAEIAQLLLEYGADVHLASKDYLPIWEAIDNEHIDIVKLLLSYNAHHNPKHKLFPLQMIACKQRSKNKEMAQLLIDAGVDIDAASSKNKITPLHLAIISNQLDLVHFFIKLGADIEAKMIREQYEYRDKKKLFTPLCLAAKYNRLEIVQYLLEKSANPNFIGTYGTALHSAAYHCNAPMIRALLKHGADLSIQDRNHQNGLPLHTLFINHNQIERDYLSALESLFYTPSLKIKKETHKRTFTLLCALHLAKGNCEGLLFPKDLRKLIWDCAFTPSLVEHQLTLIKTMCTIKGGKNNWTPEKLNKGYQDDENELTLPLLNPDNTEQHRLPFLQRLTPDYETKQEQAEQLIAAIEANDKERIKSLLAQNADPNLLIGQMSPFAFSIAQQDIPQQDLEIIQCLLDHGADVNLPILCNEILPLFIAIQRRTIEIIQLLIKYKADVNLKNKRGVTALHMAVHTRCRLAIDIAQFLLEAGADVNAQAEDGETPLIFALKEQSEQMAQFLYENGALLERAGHTYSSLEELKDSILRTNLWPT